MIDLAQKIAALSPEKRALFERKLREQGIDLAQEVILPQPRETNCFPLSFSQERLWFLDQLDGASPVYNIPSALRISGTLDVKAMQAALDQLIQRHEVLRTVFPARDSQPAQVILPHLDVDLPVIDLGEVPEPDREPEALRLARAEIDRPFDLAHGPLLRLSLYRLAPQSHLLLLVIHHIIADGWSMARLVAELAALYPAACAHTPSSLPPLPLQYADYAVWQRAWLSGEARERQLTYWRQQLAGLPPLLELPSDHPRPAQLSPRGHTLNFTFGSDLADRLRRLTQRENVTLFMLLLASFQALLSRYSGQTDIPIGVPIANRPRAELEPLIGFFANTLVLRGDLAGDPSFAELLGRVREMALGAYAHPDLPFELLVETLQPLRNLAVSPLFQVMFVLQNFQAQPIQLPNLTLAPVDLDLQTAPFDLTLNMAETANGLEGSLVYNTDLFEQGSMLRMIAHFQTLLGSIAAAPSRRISQLDLLTPVERNQVLVEWNQTQAALPVERCFHQLFEDQAERTPDAQAVFFEGEILTYRQLNERANLLAHRLRKMGVRPDRLVAICLERSVDLVTAVLAVLKAGGAYLPVDPAYPPDRQAFMLADAGVRTVISRQALLDRLSAPKLHSLLLEPGWEVSAEFSSPHWKKNPVNRTGPHHLAYVIYTSGSTGKPKGVMIEQRGVVNLYAGLQRVIYDRLPKRALRVSLNAPVSFDPSVQQMVMLASGHALYIIPQEVREDGHLLVEYIRHHRLDVVDCVPTQLQGMIAEGLLDETGYAPLAMLPGGEAIDEPTWKLLAQAKRIAFYNMYGPTECACDSTICPITGAGTTPSIGWPIINARLYILDAAMQPAPIGVPGELYIGGMGVGRGYLHRPELTAEKFIPDPFAALLPSAQGLPLPARDRLYRTGDRVRYRGDGSLEFLGRVDFQVKIRGFRIELGEIETALKTHPEIADAAVIVWPELPGGPGLVAYLVRRSAEIALSAAQVREHLRRSLPDYMVPSYIEWIDHLPLTSNGKVDRKALPRPDLSHQASSGASQAPRTPVEQILAGIWMAVLGRQQVGIHDNFFEIGGHSLLATQVISRACKAIQVELSVRALFEHPTIAELAETIEIWKQADRGVEIPPILPAAAEGEVPLSFTQERLWFLDRLDPGSPVYNLPAFVRIHGKVDVEVFERCLDEIASRHASLRTTFVDKAGEALQRIAARIRVPVKIVDLSGGPREEAGMEALRLAGEEYMEPFDLGAGPLLRVTLYRTAAEESLVLLVMHHIVSDGWSLGILVREIAALYPAFSAGEPSPLPALQIQYPDFAAWQRETLRGAVLATELDYWKEQLNDLPPLLPLPTDHPRPALQSSRGASFSFEVPHALTAELNALAQQENVTLFMLLLAAFQVLLARCTGQTDIPVGVPIANRPRAELEPLIGFFVNTLVLRGDLSGDPSFQDLLVRVREVALGAYAHQDLPFELLVDALQPQRNLAVSPLFQVMFVLQNTPGQAIELPGLTLTSLELPTQTAMFDLTLTAVETGESLACNLEYNTDLFDPGTPLRLSRHFLTLLEGLSTQPSLPISRLPLLSPNETAHLLAFNPAPTPLPPVTVAQLFEAQAARTPLAPALLGPDPLSYQALNTRANQLARRLLAHGLTPDQPVALLLERSTQAVVALLALLKAGLPTLPLDPTSPPQRLATLLAQAAPPLALTTSPLRDRLPVDLPAWLLDPLPSPDPSDPADFACPAGPHHLAYLLFTSGSTGAPKGVLVERQALLNHNLAVIQRFGLTPSDRVLQFATLSFDTAFEEIFPTLLAGGALLPRPPGAPPSGAQLEDWITHYGLTVLDLPTAYWHAWVGERQLSPHPLPPSLRLVVVGGEAALPERYRAWVESGGEEVTWLNTYGPTEATIIATSYAPPQGSLPERLPIGQPLPNLRAYVLDEARQLAPLGVVGELYLGGLGLARGYLGAPEQTAERFLPDPYLPGERVYRTGDRARWLPEGQLEYCGRVDDQLKLRGFRIEPAEIETALRQVNGVKEAIVLAHEIHQDEKSLVAYVIPQGEPAPSADDLRQALQACLPEAMVPSAFVLLDGFPLTSTGKINRQALLRLPLPSASPAADFTAPRSEVEATLARIWSQVLGVAQISVEANFFRLGGDSILSLQVVARASQAGLHLTPRQVFEHPTIAGLAAVANQAPSDTAEPDQATGPVPLTPIQRWFFAQDFPDPHHWNQSQFFSIDQRLDRDALQKAFERLIETHAALRLRFTRGDSGWEAAIAEDVEAVPVAWFDLATLPETEQRSALEQSAAEIQSSLDLAKGPLLRAACFDLGPDSPMRLVIAIHHLAVDGVSWRILLEDLQSLYGQALAGPRGSLPPKTTSYRRWAGLLIAEAQSERTLGEIPYWLAVTRGATWQIPADFPGGENSESSRSCVEMSVSAEETNRLLQKAGEAYRAEVQELLLAGLSAALAGWVVAPRLTIELEGHGREDIFPGVDLTRTVGWFTSLFPFSLDLQKDAAPAQLVKSVKTALRAVPRRGIGYGLLRYCSEDERALSIRQQAAQPDLSFNYLGQFGREAGGALPIRLAKEARGFDHAGQGRRSSLLEITASIDPDGLHVEWTFSQNLHRPETIRRLAEAFIEWLREVIEAGAPDEVEALTPFDFPLADLDQKQLDRLLAGLKPDRDRGIHEPDKR